MSKKIYVNICINLYTAGGQIFWKFSVFAMLLYIIANFGVGEGALKHVSLVVEPSAVRRGHHATLKCIYDTENTPLYSVKFYRGLREFYRFSPNETPRNKVFPFPGIHVDVASSNSSQVIIRNVGFGLSGNFSCEVTADAPSFSTATAYVQMQVVEFPERRPMLWAEHERYEPGDVLRANCSSPPSRPRAELKFALNNIVIPTNDIQYIRTTDNLIASRTSLKLHLQASHFVSPFHGVQNTNSIGLVSNAVLILRCTAQIGNFYQEYTEIELGVPQRDPIPARVTSSAYSATGSAQEYSAGILVLLSFSFTTIVKMLSVNLS